MTSKIKKSDLKKKEVLAKKIMVLREYLQEFDDEDIKLLKRAKKNLTKRNEYLKAIQGLLIGFDKAEYQIKLNELRIKRINRILGLLALEGKEWKLAKDYLQKRIQKEKMEKFLLS